jgi:hypothetical protein
MAAEARLSTSVTLTMDAGRCRFQHRPLVLGSETEKPSISYQFRQFFGSPSSQPEPDFAGVTLCKSACLGRIFLPKLV